MMQLRRVELTNLTSEQRQLLADLADEWGQAFWSLPEVEMSLQVSGTELWFLEGGANEPIRCFALTRHFEQEAELFFIYTPRNQRRFGFGRELLLQLAKQWAETGKVKQCFLEVRVSNKGACRLYESVGMKKVAKRAQYYQDGEDALIFNWSLPCEV